MVHKGRVEEREREGKKLVSQGNYQAENINQRSSALKVWATLGSTCVDVNRSSQWHAAQTVRVRGGVPEKAVQTEGFL